MVAIVIVHFGTGVMVLGCRDGLGSSTSRRRSYSLEIQDLSSKSLVHLVWPGTCTYMYVKVLIRNAQPNHPDDARRYAKCG